MKTVRYRTILKSSLVVLCLLLSGNARSQVIDLPARTTNALTGMEFAKSIATLDRSAREEKILQEIACGNVPDFLRKLVPIPVTAVENGRTNSATYYVTPDYLAIGSDDDYFLTPLSPITAQKIADLLHCSLPTRKMVNDIYLAAPVKLAPSPIPPSAQMVTVPIFIQHNLTVRGQRQEQQPQHPLGVLVAGDKKDVVISNRLLTAPGKVAIYGWHKTDGQPIQPLYAGHADYYADYSHGIRLVQLSLIVNGVARTIPEVLADPALAALLSDEGPLTQTRYPTTSQSTPAQQ